MKRLAILLLIAGLTLAPVFSSVKPVFAAEEDTAIDPSKENLFNTGYDYLKKIGEAFTESVYSDVFKTQQMTGFSNFQWVYSLLWGTAGVRQSEYLDKLSPSERMGMVQYSQAAQMSAFQMAPSANIPATYAEMLLPREIKSSGVYAALPLSNPPDANSSWGYLKNLGATKLWSVSFGISMVFVVTVLMVAGIMIIFRAKVGGQAIVTISLAVQNVFFGSIMALGTFAFGSFAMNLSKYITMVIATLFETQVLSGTSASSFLGVTYISGPVSVSNSFFAVSIVGDFAAFLKNVGYGLLGAQNFANAPLWTQLTQLAQAATGGLVPAVIASPMIFVIGRIVIGGALLITSIRIFWAVLSTYVKMILDTIIGPFVCLLGCIPGKQGTITDWVMRLLKSAIAIPFMFALVNVASFLSISIALGSSCPNLLACVTGGFIPATSSLSTDLILSAVGPHLIVALIILNMVPSVPSLVEDMFSGKSSGSLGKSFEGAKKSMQSIPVIGGLFQ